MTPNVNMHALFYANNAIKGLKSNTWGWITETALPVLLLRLAAGQTLIVSGMQGKTWMTGETALGPGTRTMFTGLVTGFTNSLKSSKKTHVEWNLLFCLTVALCWLKKTKKEFLRKKIRKKNTMKKGHILFLFYTII